jgi:hypothetical protein
VLPGFIIISDLILTGSAKYYLIDEFISLIPTTSMIHGIAGHIFIYLTKMTNNLARDVSNGSILLLENGRLILMNKNMRVNFYS